MKLKPRSKLRTPKFLCKASSAEQQLEQEEANFYQTLTQNYQTQFANQSSILSSLDAAYQPILAAGPGQFGFTPAETTALRTQATDSTAQTYQNAETALNESLASKGGGNAFLPSGAAAQLQAGLNTSAAQQQSTQQLGITQAGYAQGLSNFDTAAQVLGGVAGQYNPLGYAGASTNANQAAFSEADTIQQQNSAWEGELGGIIGGVAGSVLGGPIGGALAKNIAPPPPGANYYPGGGNWT